MECNGECVFTFGAGRWGNLSGRRVKFGIKMELMEEEHGPEVRTPQPENAANSFTGTTKLLKMMRLKEGLQLIRNNFYCGTKIETLRDRLVWSVEKVADWILQRTILLIMKQEIQLNLTGKIGCRHFMGVSTEKENPVLQNRNRFHEMFRNAPTPREHQEIEEDERLNPPEARDRLDVKEVPPQAHEEEEAYDVQLAEQHLIRRARERYEDFGKKPGRDTIIQVEEESLRLIPRVFSRELQNLQRNDKVRREADSDNVMQGVNINRMGSTSSNVQKASKKNHNTSADWYFRRHRSKRRGGK